MAQINTQDRVGKRSGAVQFEHYQVGAIQKTWLLVYQTVVA